jgi:3-dehydroquinate dehydratase / shikimate dehydrogenase
MSFVLLTKNLILRPWHEADLEPFAAMNADPRVMEFFPTPKTYEESLKEYKSILAHFEKHGYGWWAVSVKHGSPFIGFIGLRYIDFPAAFTPAVEVAWRLEFDHWGKGYATEGALAALKYGFEQLLESAIPLL